MEAGAILSKDEQVVWGSVGAEGVLPFFTLGFGGNGSFGVCGASFEGALALGMGEGLVHGGDEIVFAERDVFHN